MTMIIHNDNKAMNMVVVFIIKPTPMINMMVSFVLIFCLFPLDLTQQTAPLTER